MAKPKAVGNTVKRTAAVRAKGLGQTISLVSVHKQMASMTHSHFCSNRECRTYFEDSCSTPERNGRCQLCRGEIRTWIDRATGLHAHDPRPCCTDNTVQVTDPKTLLRHMLAGPGPWYQCRTCKRAHGNPCITPTERNT